MRVTGSQNLASTVVQGAGLSVQSLIFAVSLAPLRTLETL